MTEYIVLDTNIILLDANNILNIGNSNTEIVLPATVIDEVDSKKSGFTEIAYQAREFGRLLSLGHKRKSVAGKNYISTYITVDTRKVIIVEPTSYPDFTDTEANIIADRKIIHTAGLWSNDNENTKFMSNDVMARIRAISSGVATTELKQVDKTAFEFTKQLEVTDEQFVALHNKPIFDIDPIHLPENFNYIFTAPNTAQHKLAYIDNGTIQILGKTTEDALRRQALNPINVEQLMLARAIQDTSIDVVVCEALAGF